MLIWARTQSDTLEFNSGKFDLNEIVEENIRFVEPIAIKKQVRINYRSNRKALVFADKNMIDTVLRNLLTNAIKFSFPESEIHVIRAEDEHNYFYSIKDNGVGISPIDIQKLFRLDSKISMPGTQNEKGSGLGLLICKEFMEKIGGHIVVTSELGEKEVSLNLFSLKHSKIRIIKNLISQGQLFRHEEKLALYLALYLLGSSENFFSEFFKSSIVVNFFRNKFGNYFHNFSDLLSSKPNPIMKERHKRFSSSLMVPSAITTAIIS
ncbi:MAG: HAMP domain-containing histidine kinase [Bacteroidetes bacterium]|nr:HAMP domain-containing histidine kinase [Bacteroidota bacterium]